MENFSQAPVRRKVNPAFVAFGALAAAACAASAWIPSSESRALIREADSLRSQIAAGEQEISSDPTYLSAKSYGERVAAADALSKIKASRPEWFRLLDDVRAALPRQAAVRSFSYSPESSRVSLQVTAPDAKGLIRAAAALEDMGAFRASNFNSFVPEKVTFKGDKAQYSGLSAKLDAEVDPEWLEREYSRAADMASARRAARAEAPKAASSEAAPKIQ